MKIVTIEEIKQLAEKFASKNKNWHFHILTPSCQLNDRKSYSLILENLTDREEYAVFSDIPYMTIGKELVQLLHGKDVIKNEGENKEILPSLEVAKLLERAKTMNTQGKFWHHHMLFPNCRFNNHGNKWVIVFEDQEKGETIESLSDNEPKNNLQYIEKLFYAQEKLTP